MQDGDLHGRPGQNIGISYAQVASKMILLARSTSVEDAEKPSESLPLVLIHSNGVLRKMGGRAFDVNEANSLIGE